MNGSAKWPAIDLPADPQPTYDHEVYDLLALWLVWLPLGLAFAVVFVSMCVLMSPVLLPLWLLDRHSRT